MHSEDADGKLAGLRIGHAFGVEPLRQYPMEGRRQALSIARDRRPARSCLPDRQYCRLQAQALRSASVTPRIDKEHQAMSRLAETVSRELLQAIRNDQLVLPTLPEAALRIRQTVQQPDIGIAELAREVGSDTALTARLIRVANSPLLRARTEITDLQMAISRLGINYTSTLAIGLALEQMFRAKSPIIERKMHEIWSKSLEVSSISYVLSRNYTTLVPEQAALAGLVHQIGALPILTYAENHPELLQDPQSLTFIIDEVHPAIGDRILHQWNFPESIASIPSQHLNFSRDTNDVDYADVVQVAVLQSYLDTDHLLAGVDWGQVAAFAKLGLDCEVDSAEDSELAASLVAAMSA